MVNRSVTKVQGLRQLGERFHGLDFEMQTKIARAATGAAAAVIKKGAKRRAPVADQEYTVRSRKGDAGVVVQPANIPKNIISKRVTSSLTSEHIVTVRGKRKDGYAKRIGILQEYGTAHSPAQPFLRPALDEDKGQAVVAMAGRIKARLKKAGK